MPVTFYVGVPKSGKSYSIVKNVVLPAIESGRTVITNIAGISEDAIHGYLKVNSKTDPAVFGHVVSVSLEDCRSERFMPREGVAADTIIKGGELVIIDEAQMFWGYGDKLSQAHLDFLTYHGHFVDPETNRCCDIVLATQDLRLINRKALGVVEQIFKIEKNADGPVELIIVSYYRGSSMTKANLVKVDLPEKFDKEIFPLYHGFIGGKGVVVGVDANSNIFRSKKFKILIAFIVLVGGFSVYSLMGIFATPEPKKEPAAKPAKPGAPVASAAAAVVKPPELEIPLESDWRVVGHYRVGSALYIQLRRGDSFRTLIAPKGWYIDSLRAYGQLDGRQLANWTGAAPEKVGGMGLPGIKK